MVLAAQFWAIERILGHSFTHMGICGLDSARNASAI